MAKIENVAILDSRLEYLAIDKAVVFEEVVIGGDSDDTDAPE